MSTAQSAAVEQPKSRVWMWVLAVTCLGLFAAAASKPDFAGDLAYGMGYYLLPSIVAAFLFGVVFSSVRKLRWLAFVLIYGSLIAGHAIGVQTQKERARQVTANLKQTFKGFAEQSAVEPGQMPKAISLQPTTSNVEGDAGLTEVVTKTLMNEIALMQNEYLKALMDAGWGKLLDAERLSKDKGMKESRTILAAAEALVGKYRAKSSAFYDSVPQRVRQAPFHSEVTRREFAKGVEDGIAKSRQKHTATWDYELQIVREYGAVIELLAKREGHYAFNAQREILFDDQADADAYNAHMAKADELLKAQSEIARRAQSEAIRKLESAVQ